METHVSTVGHQIDSKLILPIFGKARDDDNIPRFDSSVQTVDLRANNHTVVCH